MLSSKQWNNKTSDIKLVSLHSTIKTMHGPINLRSTNCFINELEVDVRATAFDPCIANRKGCLFSSLWFICCNFFHKSCSPVRFKAPVTVTTVPVLLYSSNARSCCLHPATGVCVIVHSSRWHGDSPVPLSCWSDNKGFLCITRTVKHNYILLISIVRIQLHVSALCVGYLQVEIF